MDTANFAEHSPQREAARGSIAEAVKSPVVTRGYVHAARQVTKVLHRHGLGQTLAYMRLRAGGKPNSPYELLARQLDRWLLSTLAVKAPSALDALTTRDSCFYLEANEQAWLFIEALGHELKEVS
jgi:alkylated DNA nucleotide flippase Atl1